MVQLDSRLAAGAGSTWNGPDWTHAVSLVPTQGLAMTKKLPARSSSINSCSAKCFNSGSSWQVTSRNPGLASGSMTRASPNNFSTDCLCWPIFPSGSRTNCPPAPTGVRISYGPRSGNLIALDEKSAARGSDFFAGDWRRVSGLCPEDGQTAPYFSDARSRCHLADPRQSRAE